MARVLPPRNFARARLQVHSVAAGLRFGRIYMDRYPDPLGFGKTPSRFSDPRQRVAASRFGVLYPGQTVKVCFLEAVLRDQRDGVIGDVPIEEKEFLVRRYAEIETTAPLKMVDLRDVRAVVITRRSFAIVGIRIRGIYSLPDQKPSRKAIHASFNHHRRRVRDRSCGRAPVGSQGSVPDVAWTRGERGGA